MSSDERRKKVLVIGLDAATPELLMRWVREGKLPTFAELIDEGVYGKLKSTIPFVTCPAWLSFMTGKNPGKLGIFDFVERAPGTYDIKVVDFQSAKSKSLWGVLSERGKKVGVFNVPTTFPPRKVNGFVVSGWPIPQGAVFTYPSDLQSKLGMLIRGQEGPDRTIMMATWRWFAGEDEYLEGLYRFTEREVKATKYLMENYDWDFFMTVFTCSDPIQHFFWKYMDPEHPLHSPDGAKRYGDEILKFYQRMDKTIRDLLNSVSDDVSVIIMSDHGAEALHNFFNVNDWLCEKGFLVIKKGSRHISNPLSRLLPRKERILDPVIHLAHSLGLLRVYYFITDHSSILRALVERVWSLIEAMPSTHASIGEVNVDWSKTNAYSFGTGNVGSIHINLKGREPEGIIDLGEQYEELRTRLVGELRDLIDPKSGRKVDITIFKKEEIYHGEYLSQAPDIVFFTNDFKTGIDATFGHDDFFTYDLSGRHDNGKHRLNGILILKGPQFKEETEISGAEIIDVAPTILYMMNCPIPSDMDGKVLTDAFRPSYLESNPAKYEEVMKETGPPKYKWSKEDEERIKERLKALGYIE